MFCHIHSGPGEAPGVKNHPGLAPFISESEPSDFLGIYKKAISAWGLYHYKAFKGAMDKITNSLHWRHFPGSKHCGHTCHPGSFANITANQISGPSVFSCLWVGRDRSCLSEPQQMCWDQVITHGRLHPSNRCPSVSSEPLPSVWTCTETTILNIFLIKACLQETHIFSSMSEVTETPELTMCQGLERDKESPCLQLCHKEAWNPNVLLQEAGRYHLPQHREWLKQDTHDRRPKLQDLGQQSEWVTPPMNSSLILEPDVSVRSQRDLGQNLP